MNKWTNKIGNIILGGVLVGSLVACSSDWLDTAPEKSTGTSTIFETTENAKLAINGLCKLMNTPYPVTQAGRTTQDYNGEGVIKLLYGNWMGNHFIVANRDGYVTVYKGSTYLNNISHIECYYPWWYYYMVIGNANTIVANIDAAEGSDNERKFIKAQALTFRAYAYTMLAQLYCHRWCDSNEGATPGVVLRTDVSSGALALSTLKQVYQQIYTDLDEAIRCYTESGLSRPEGDNYSPDIAVAYATYARASLNRQDYATALSMASKARTNYPLMSNADYCAGFNEPTSEWIWSSCSSTDIGVYSYFYRIGYNTEHPTYLPRPSCIRRELLESIPEGDIRRSLFLDVKDVAETSYDRTTKATAGQAVAKGVLDNLARSLHPDFPEKGTVYAYMQFKIKNKGVGEGHLNHFRSSEMLLIEAEANYFLKKPEEAQKALIALNKTSGRNETYTCTKTGNELWEEIKRYRALELWGEGFDWFDMKRWKEPIDRKTYPDGGNSTANTAFNMPVDDNDGWTWAIPSLETDYNDSLN